MNDTIRYIVAGLLIFIIIILQPFYLEWLGYEEKAPKKNENALSLNDLYHSESPINEDHLEKEIN